MPVRAAITSLGTYVPDRVVTNDDLSLVMETSDEWIEQRTGIRQRHHIDRDTGATDLGVEAAREALAAAGLGIADIDLLIFATLSPDIDWPSCACLVIRR